jgi:hypothetical protein
MVVVYQNPAVRRDRRVNLNLMKRQKPDRILIIGPGKLTERKLSLTVQLSAPEEYTGGELIIYPNLWLPRIWER